MASKDIKLTDKDIARFWGYVARSADYPEDACWEWLGACSGARYGVFWAGGTTISAHKVAWMISNKQDVPDGLVVRHSCDNRPCCRPSHLSLGTAFENGQDRARGRKYLKLGTHKSGIEYRPSGRGETAGRVSLTREQVIEIRKRRSDTGATYVELAAEFGVGESTIGSVVQRLTWGFLGDDGVELYPPKPGRVGENHHKAKLTNEQVREIRRLFSDEGLTYQELGRRFGITDKNAGMIVRRVTWRHI